MSAVAPSPRSPYGYRTPGVYFEWLDASPPLGIARTDIAGFVGIAQRGPVHVPIRLESWTQFASVFGSYVPQGYLAYAVDGFFANGGQTCWVVRVADGTAAPASIQLDDDAGLPTLLLTAGSEGTWGELVTVTVMRAAADRFSLAIRLPDGTTELWRNLTMDPGSPRYVETQLNAPRTGSKLVSALDLRPPTAPPRNTPSPRGRGLRYGVGRLAGGKDGLAGLTPADFTGSDSQGDVAKGLAAFERVDEIAIVAIPDAMPKPVVPVVPPAQPPLDCTDLGSAPLPPPPPPADAVEFPPAFTDLEIAEVQGALIEHCTLLADRIAVLDSRPEDLTPAQAEALRLEFDSSYAALYYPWLRVPDPPLGDGFLRAVPPSGHVAGVYARVDRRIGVHEPPANEVVERIEAVTVDTGDIAHGDLNEAGVNVVRVFNGRGLRIGGARTTTNDPDWRYVNVRRLLLMIEKSVGAFLDACVFEPNSQPTWREVDRVVRGFLDDLWRRGMLDGASPVEAYSVQCDETTNPPEAQDAGRLTCLVGVLPPWPAEFVVVRIGRTQAASETGSDRGAERA